MRRRVVLALLVPAVVAAGCGVRGDETPHASELVVLKRWYGTDPLVSEVHVAGDGSALYEVGFGGNGGHRAVRVRLPAGEYARMRALVRETRMRGADRASAEPAPGGFHYVLRIGARSVSTSDGHLTPGVRPVIRALDRIAWRLTDRIP